MSSCETHWLPRMNDGNDQYISDSGPVGALWEQDRVRVLAEHLAGTKRQPVGVVAHLRKLRASHKRTIALLARGQIACEQSRLLLDRVDGLPFSTLLSEIHHDD